MRLAVLIIALCLSIAVGLQSCAIFSGGSIVQDETLAQGGAVGVVVALLFVLGAAFAMGLPRVSAACFALAAALAFLVSGSTKFSDLAIWGGVAAILAVMAWFGSRELRRKTAVPAIVEPQAAVAKSPKETVDIAAQLERLAKLRSDESISEAEFESLKARLLQSQ